MAKVKVGMQFIILLHYNALFFRDFLCHESVSQFHSTCTLQGPTTHNSRRQLGNADLILKCQKLTCCRSCLYFCMIPLFISTTALWHSSCESRLCSPGRRCDDFNQEPHHKCAVQTEKFVPCPCNTCMLIWLSI